MRYLIPLALTLATLAGCAAPPTAREIRPPIVAAPPPRPTPAPPPLASDWNDWSFTPGDWRYVSRHDSSSASFDGGDQFRLALACDRATRRIRMTGMRFGAITIRTTTLTRRTSTETVPADPPYAGVTLAATDALLDAMAFSRGRIVVERTGEAPLVLPPYAEIGRVIEDCRG